MSSATSIEKAEAKPAAFGVWHFFILLSLIAATVAVLMAGQNTPENLVVMSLTIGAAGVASAALYRTLAPLTASDHELSSTQPLTDRLRADLEREKGLVLRSIKELEFDRAMGKVSARDFDEMAGRLRSRAMALMQQLDEGRNYRSVIERELQSRAAVVKPRAAHVCSCGTTNDADAKFCKSCGSKLA
jgi:hypothetical protein